MYIKSLVAGIAMASIAGFAYAQEEHDPVDAQNEFASEAEAEMYADTEMWSPFYTDDTWTELRTDEEVAEAFTGADELSQDEIRSACDRVQEDEAGNYGQVTITLCSQIGEL